MQMSDGDPSKWYCHWHFYSTCILQHPHTVSQHRKKTEKVKQNHKKWKTTIEVVHQLHSYTVTLFFLVNTLLFQHINTQVWSRDHKSYVGSCCYDNCQFTIMSLSITISNANATGIIHLKCLDELKLWNFSEHISELYIRYVLSQGW